MQETLIVEVDASVNPHSHLREGDELMSAAIREVYNGGVEVVGGMPNTKIPLTTADRVTTYNARLRELTSTHRPMTFISIAQVTEETTFEDMLAFVEADIWDFKLYPRDRTTNSMFGIVCYWRVIEVIKRAAAYIFKTTGRRIRVHPHPEHPAMTFIGRDAEYLFLPVAYMLIEETEAIIIWEHGTDARCIPHWKRLAESGRFYVTLTAHHLATNEDKTFGDVRATCKPSIKTEPDRAALVQLVCEDHPWVMLGADDAPHDMSRKHVHEGRCDCGAYTAPFLVPLCAHVLDQLMHTEAGIQIFNNFTSRNARKLYGLPPAVRKLKLARQKTEIPACYRLGPWTVESFWAKQVIEWSFAE